jgi:23S rRNA (cytosine1962-C5)-methyltransferase
MEKPSDPPTPQPRLKLTLKSSTESIVRGGHPWVYSDSIRTQNREGEAGELAVIYDRKNSFLAAGFYDPDSPLRVRIVHLGKPATIDEDWWRTRLEETLERRKDVADEATTGLRLINGESDGWPGLVLDRYDNTLVLKLYTPAWLGLLEMLRRIIAETIHPERLVLRMSRNLQTKAAQFSRPLQDGGILDGAPLEGVVVFLESGIRFESDVLRGQKTGFFLDQRENRRRVETLTSGSDVLNAFSFSGGFSLYAARGGAKSVTNLDISAHALAAAERNRELNLSNPGIVSCSFHSIQDDAFLWIERAAPSQFDVVIVDPPSLAKRESERIGAIRAYAKLNANAMRLLRPGGVLVAASCSAHVSAEEFFGAVRLAAKQSGGNWSEMDTSGHAPDHHATFPEANYLKCLYLKKS